MRCLWQNFLLLADLMHLVFLKDTTCNTFTPLVAGTHGHPYGWDDLFAHYVRNVTMLQFTLVWQLHHWVHSLCTLLAPNIGSDVAVQLVIFFLRLPWNTRAQSTR